MLSFVTWLLIIILIPITGLHVYWLFGGEKALDGALPNDYYDSKRLFTRHQLIALRIFLLGPVVLTLGFLIGCLLSLFPFISPYQSMIYKGFAILFIARGLLGPFFNRFTKKNAFKVRNAFIYSPVAFLIGILFYTLYLFNFLKMAT